MASYKKFIVELAKKYNEDYSKLTYERSEGNYTDVFEDGSTYGQNEVFFQAQQFLESTKKQKVIA